MKKISYDELGAFVRTGVIKNDTFLTSPLYYLLVGRKGVKIYHNADSAVVVCVHPLVKDRLMIFPELGKEDYELTVSVLEMLLPPRNGVQLARFAEREIQLVEERICARPQSSVVGVQVFEETVEDWRFPIRILCTQKVSAMKGRRFQNIRNKLRAVDSEIEAVPLDQKSTIRSIRANLKLWERNMISKRKNVPGMSDVYEELIRILKDDASFVDGLLFRKRTRPVGVAIWDRPYANTSNLLANLTDISIPGLAEFQVVSVCRQLNQRGVLYLNRGGSETAGLDRFKAKFDPIKSIPVRSARVVYRSSTSNNFESVIRRLDVGVPSKLIKSTE